LVGTFEYLAGVNRVAGGEEILPVMKFCRSNEVS